MVNPNHNWSSDKESDDDDKTTEKRTDSSRPIRPMPIPVERITPPPAPQEGIMYTRAAVSVPLSELIARHAEVKLPDDDDEEDDDEQDDSYARADARKAAEAPEPLTDQERQAAEQAKADRAENSHIDTIESDAVVQPDAEAPTQPPEHDATHLQPVLVEAAPEPAAAQSARPDRPAGATYRSVHASNSVSAQPAAEAPAPMLQAAETPADLRPTAPLNPFEGQRPATVSHAEMADTPLQYAAAEAAYAQPGYAPNAAPQPSDNDAESNFSVPNLAGDSEYGTFDNAANVHLGYRNTSEASPEQVTVNARDRRLGPAIFIAMGVDYAARRRMKKQHAAVQKQQAQALERTNDQQQQFATEQQRFGQEQQRAGREQQQQAAVLETVRTQQREQMAAMPLTYAEQSQVDRIDQQSQQVRAEQPQQIIQPESRVFEGQRPVGPAVAAERPLAPVAMTPEAPRQPAAEQQAAPQEQAAEQAQEPVRRIEDGWLWRDVNKRGEVVETNRTYGEAYHQERQQEIVQDRTGDSDNVATGASTAATGYAAGSGAASMGYAAPSDGLYTQSQQAQPHQYGTLPSGMTTPSLPQGQHADAQHQLQAGGEPDGQQMRSNVSNPWFWLMLMLIVAAFFTAALI